MPDDRVPGLFETKRKDGRLKVSAAKKLQTENTDMAMTLVRVANVGPFGARKARKLARECLARLGGEE